MKIDILTLFPNVFCGPLSESIVKRAIEKKIVGINVVNIRDYACDKHKTADDYPFGGGKGMVMKPEPVFKAVSDISGLKKSARIVLLSASGEKFDSKKAAFFSKQKHIVLICGHYEGVDERVRENLATDDISIGDYILTGGEFAALIVMDAVIRLIPGVLGNSQSITDESFNNDLLEYPQYTRPAVYGEMKVPDVLLSGNHKMIEDYRRQKSLELTLKKRPDLLEKANLSKNDKLLLRKIRKYIKSNR